MTEEAFGEEEREQNEVANVLRGRRLRRPPLPGGRRPGLGRGLLHGVQYRICELVRIRIYFNMNGFIM